MLNSKKLLLALVFAALATRAMAAPVSVVVSTSMLESAVRDLELGDDQITITTLVPPGSCPGHFDVSPSIVPVLRKASVLLLHDFQQGLADRVRALTDKNLDVITVREHGSLLIPEAYGTLVGSVAEALAAALPAEQKPILEAARKLETSLAATEENLREQARPWHGKAIIASIQQRTFCEWLGFRVVGVLPRPEDLTPKELTRLLGLKAQLVVGNLQSDADAAQVLADRMRLPVAILSNFPHDAGSKGAYHHLLDANLKALDRAWHSRD